VAALRGAAESGCCEEVVSTSQALLIPSQEKTLLSDVKAGGVLAPDVPSGFAD